ncbi:3-hydroxyacyl-CoA dehydrogenase NAD-binding domain-containing protein [Pseudomonas sp. A014]|uniref:3-hydroxyacyl-CoA dehydrogenase NAD-binding domain-containing protein n=1 Tax=Pseudomonas sp. A014 TaxID=3458058 RepID=UPI0040353046
MSINFSVRDGVACIALDHPPLNTLGGALRQALMAALARAEGDPAVRGIVLHGATSRAFSAGADITEFDGAQVSPGLGELIQRIEGSRLPVLAAIEGHALGGGLELALGCHLRVVGEGASLGLPEIKLGLIPGAGGTQRLPRLVGMATAHELIISGRSLGAAEAVRLGLAEACLPAPLVENALAWLQDYLAQGHRTLPMAEREVAEQALGDPLGTHAGPALAAARQCVEASARLPLAEGLAEEQAAFAALVRTPESAALRHAFFAERQAAAAVSAAAPRELRRAAVIGAGTMGSGIAICLLDAGLEVRLLDVREAAVQGGMDTITEHYRRQQAKGRLSADQVQARLHSLWPTTDYADLADCDLLIEAVFERLDIKQAVFEQLDRVARPGAVLASNTSTLDIDRIAAFTQRPGDVLGLHFFSPAPVMRLLEIVRGRATSDAVLRSAQVLARRMGKVGVVAGVCDGFIGNRMWHQYLRQASQLVAEGATPQQVDQAMQAWGFAMGPFRVADLAGLDVGLMIRQRWRDDYPDQPWAGWLDAVSASGRVGLKGGAGIYRYQGREALVDEEIQALIVAWRHEQGLVPQAFDDQAIVRRCVQALIVEGARLLQAGIARRASDVDAVFINGYGFPRWRGGPLFQADQWRLDSVVAGLRAYAGHAEPGFWAPPPLLVELAASGRPLGQWVKQEEQPQ